MAKHISVPVEGRQLSHPLHCPGFIGLRGERKGNLIGCLALKRVKHPIRYCGIQTERRDECPVTAEVADIEMYIGYAHFFQDRHHERHDFNIARNARMAIELGPELQRCARPEKRLRPRVKHSPQVT